MQNLAHTASTAVFTFVMEGPGVQELSDESWAMDQLTVSVTPVPEPSAVWLAVAGLAGLAGGFESGHAWHDAAIHALALGFVFAMVFGHAPIIFPAVAKVRIPYHPFFYLPLAVLHVSVLARLIGDLSSNLALGQAAGVANALALLLFIVTMVISVARGQKKWTRRALSRAGSARWSLRLNEETSHSKVATSSRGLSHFFSDSIRTRFSGDS